MNEEIGITMKHRKDSYWTTEHNRKITEHYWKLIIWAYIYVWPSRNEEFWESMGIFKGTNTS